MSVDTGMQNAFLVACVLFFLSLLNPPLLGPLCSNVPDIFLQDCLSEKKKGKGKDQEEVV